MTRVGTLRLYSLGRGDSVCSLVVALAVSSPTFHPTPSGSLHGWFDGSRRSYPQVSSHGSRLIPLWLSRPGVLAHPPFLPVGTPFLSCLGFRVCFKEVRKPSSLPAPKPKTDVVEIRWRGFQELEGPSWSSTSNRPPLFPLTSANGPVVRALFTDPPRRLESWTRPRSKLPRPH